MARFGKKHAIIMAILVLLLYAFIAAGRVTEETVISLNWITSLEKSFAEVPPPEDAPLGALIPFELGERVGYVSEDGRFSINKLKNAYVSMSDYLWAEYGARDENITVKNQFDEAVFNIENGRGYPFFLDSRSFIIHTDQNSISMLDAPSGAPNGAAKIAWTYDFASPLTCVDAASGFLLAGTLDGAVELINGEGRRVYFFEPSGSRIATIYGCAISKDGKKIALVSGLDRQRFILIEQSGSSWRVTFHEFLDEGLRRNVYAAFVDDDSKIVFERENALGIYDIKSRAIYKIPLSGEVLALDDSGVDGHLFLITSQNEYTKIFTGIKFPDIVMIEAPFSSHDAFLARKGEYLFVGGKTTLASFKIEKK
jgi:hypothetical protein